MMNTFSCCVCGTAIAVIETDHSLLDLVKADATDDELLSIIDQRPHTIFAADSEGKTVLMWACDRARYHVVQRVIENMVNLEAKDMDGYTAMMYAARSGDMQICNYLLSLGASLEPVSFNGKFTALSLAAAKQYIDLCVVLIHAGADVTTKDCVGLTPLDLLRGSKKFAQIKTLISSLYDEKTTSSTLHRRRVESATERSVSLPHDRHHHSSFNSNTISYFQISR